METAKQYTALFNPLGEKDIRRIHDDSVDVLKRVGLWIEDGEARHILREAGADVDETTWVARLPEAMIIDALQAVPHEVKLCDIAGNTLDLTGGRNYFGTCANVPYVWQPDTGETRRATRQDVADLVRLADALSSIRIIATPVHASDVPEQLSALYEYEALLLNTAKHWLAAPQTCDEAKICVELAEVICGDGGLATNPILSMAISTTSPLRFDQESARMLALIAERNIPFITLPVPMAGGTSPLTLAGTLLIQNAEFLFSLTLSQIMNKGTPVIYGAVSSIMDMRTGNISRGGAEYALLACATSQLARFYGLPSYGVHAMTESAELDGYNGGQKMFCIFSGLASGANISIGAGQLASAKVASGEQLILDNEFYNVASRFLKGIAVDEETLALTTIEKVGHGGHYLAEEHTLKWLRSGEHYYSQLFFPAAWEKEGKQMIAAAGEKVKEILREHVPAVPERIVERVKGYVQGRLGERRG